MECVVVDDGSRDGTFEVAIKWISPFLEAGIKLTVEKQENRGAGAARNSAIQRARGEWLVILDADDVCLKRRIRVLADHARCRRTLYGSRFSRRPPNADARYTSWANTLDPERLSLERYRECTVIQPTWCFHRQVFESAGGYLDDGPDDLHFFHRHLLNGGLVERIDDDLVIYRSSPLGLAKATPRRTLLRCRTAYFAEAVLSRDVRWKSFSVWGAGRDAKAFVNFLADLSFVSHVRALHDVDRNKVHRPYVNKKTGLRLDVLSIDAIEPPFVVCVALDRYGDPLVKAVHNRLRTCSGPTDESGFLEGRDFWFFT